MTIDLTRASGTSGGTMKKDAPRDARLVLEAFNRTAADIPADRCLHEWFEARVDRTPDAVAVLSGDEEITYAQLEARANRLAHHLAALGVGPEVRVGICLERGPDVVVALLAVLKAGGAYVPLDPAYPPERLAAMLADAGAALVIAQEQVRALLPRGAAVVALDREAERIAAAPAHRPASGVEPRNLAYVIYTSGSTGTPKGIAIAHRGVVNNLLDWNRRFGIGAEDRTFLVSSLSFDISVFEALGILAAGGAVVVPAHAELRDPARWAALMRRHGVTVWNSATALLGMLADHLHAAPEDAPRALRLAFAGGDWVPLELAGRLRARIPGLRVVALGGVTEVSIYSVAYEIGNVDPAWPSIPYGAPLGNQRAYVLDDALRPLPVGEPGEMYLGGVGVARGYAGRPAFTAERFLPDPHGGGPGARMYRTGDRARWLADGNLQFLGRLDAQVKIRGNRVEPGEVEAVLRRHPGVERCAAGARGDETGETRLVAWFTGAAEPESLREHARHALPPYMVPSAFVRMEALPLSPNGKLDRRALPAPRFGAERPYLPPSTPVEEALAAMWASVLPVERVGADDDFFELGGESLGVMRMIGSVRAALGVELTFRAVMDHPTLAALAAEVERMLYDEIVAMDEDQAERLAALAPTPARGAA
ncbi:MAG TPA: non-ribosomal peptide synthetase [Longimicrobium sp.]|nr:non-ribosomal peptide synthetase [Longimicrobium sp.]